MVEEPMAHLRGVHRSSHHFACRMSFTVWSVQFGMTTTVAGNHVEMVNSKLRDEVKDDLSCTIRSRKSLNVRAHTLSSTLPCVSQCGCKSFFT